jgi:hypothetical protein
MAATRCKGDSRRGGRSVRAAIYFRSSVRRAVAGRGVTRRADRKKGRPARPPGHLCAWAVGNNINHLDDATVGQSLRIAWDQNGPTSSGSTQTLIDAPRASVSSRRA